MKNEGPFLQTLTHRLAECPAEFLAPPRVGGRGDVHVAAVVGDLLRDFSRGALTLQDAAFLGENFAPRTENEFTRNRLQLVLVAAWLLRDDWFHGRETSNDEALNSAVPSEENREIEYSKLRAQQLSAWLTTGLNDLALVVAAPQFVSDADRREELARRALAAIGFRPRGESEPQSQNRLTTLDSIERQRVVLETRAAQLRAQTIREAMQEKARQEAAARYTRE